MNARSPIRTLLGHAALACALAACGSDRGGGGGVVDPPTPVPGVLTVTFTTPGGGDRAALLSITAPEAMTLLEGAAPGYLVHQRTTGTTTRVAVFGPLTGGPLLLLHVPDVNKAAQFTVTLQEVADGSNALRQGTGYSVAITR